ncbi:carboxymuconolactone decarboxylase family protein [Hyphomonas sp. FCG-A18]|uniref:carboxymuconolactone decarboxylase family protein n=1 Tax=Hyphomonas sp. FCG-A18 TaxID=3080019 RepID=UPI002B2D0EC9|nr:carboxymuconolactone decarboxylase family protein [Hyphomonas sp. FCG-A18]
MAKFQLHTPETAPDGSRDFISGVNKKMGFVPSLYAVFAENPAVLNAYNQLSDQLGQSGLTALEQQVVTITASVENECHFCVAAHTTISEGAGLDLDVIYAVREDRPIADPKLEALRVFTKKTVIDRGFVSDADVEAFLSAGYTRANVLAVILGVALKVISNYTNHLAETPVDEAFAKHAWTPELKREAAMA